MAYKSVEDQKTYNREHYQRNKTKYQAKARASQKRTRKRNHEFLLNYLHKHPCVDCGESDPIVLEFDHVRGQKIAAVTFLGNQCRPIRILEEEISKCEIRCANCHRRKTAAQVNGYRSR